MEFGFFFAREASLSIEHKGNGTATNPFFSFASWQKKNKNQHFIFRESLLN